MSSIEYITIAFHHLRMNVLRTLLTMLGIIIGIGSIIAVLSIGQGGRLQIDKELQKFGINRIGIYSTKGLGMNPMTLKDVEVLKQHVKEIQSVSPLVYKSGNIYYRQQYESVDFVGTDSELAQIEEIPIKAGRFLTESDIEYGRKVIVLSENVAQKLFGNRDPLYQKVVVQNQSFSVVGIQQSTASFAENMIKDKAYIPITTFHKTFNTRWINEIAITVFNREHIDQTVKQAIQIMERRHSSADNFKSYNFVKEMEMAHKVINTFTLVVGAIAAVSLLVGGIGVMNIMLVTVTERTQEIGIRKALGARNGQILGQFLAEALIISFIGGVLGTGMGIFLTFLASKFIRIPVTISMWNILMAVFFSTGVGIFSGIYPARKAAALDPIEALRHD